MQNGDVVGIALCDGPNGVLRSGTVLHRGSAELVATACARVAVGDMYRVSFLTGNYGTNAQFGGAFDEVGVWKPRYDFYPLLLQDMGNQVGAVHGLSRD